MEIVNKNKKKKKDPICGLWKLEILTWYALTTPMI